MIVGFNHNINYKGVGFHVQTEDSGIEKPHLITLLYHGGTIITSQKTVYADILKVDNLEQVVEELAKEQHKGMLKRLTHGEFDSKIVALGIPLGGAATETSAVKPVEAPVEAPTPKPVEAPSPVETALEQKTPEPAPAAQVEPALEKIAAEAPEPVSIVEEPIIDKFRKEPARDEMSLDELIFAYLTAGQKN